MKSKKNNMSYNKIRKRDVVGLVEEITLYGSNGKKKKVVAKIDTGASVSSVDIDLAANLNLGPLIKVKHIRSSHGVTRRPYVKALVEIKGKKIETLFSLADRSHLRYSVLIGANTLKQGRFIIDPLIGKANNNEREE